MVIEEVEVGWWWSGGGEDHGAMMEEDWNALHKQPLKVVTEDAKLT